MPLRRPDEVVVVVVDKPLPLRRADLGIVQLVEAVGESPQRAGGGLGVVKIVSEFFQIGELPLQHQRLGAGPGSTDEDSPCAAVVPTQNAMAPTTDAASMAVLTSITISFDWMLIRARS